MRDRIRACVRCGQMTRPAGVRLADHPGTVCRASAELCGTCYSHDYKAGMKHAKPAKVAVSPACVRCGFERKSSGSNMSPLCRDCRDVLTTAEQALWRDAA